MKQGRLTIIAFSLFWVYFSQRANGQSELPGAPSTIQTVKAGSFVVPMDNDLQNIVPAGQAPFNLKAYGLINEFLQQGIPVKWIIKQTKQKDEIDFSATVTRIAPSALPSAALDFRSGPFILPDTTLPCGLSTQQVIQKFGNNVAVYRLEADASVPVRYTLTHRPKIAVFNNGGNQVIHTKILDAAGITDYDVMDAANIGALINCYTFVSEPHADDPQVSPAVITAVRSFIMNGGNFLAQCHAITAYENQGFFVSTKGIHDVAATVTNQYHQSPLAISQFHSAFQENEGGSVQNFALNTGSSWHPHTYKIITGAQDDTVVVIGSHLLGPTEPGGNVFYLGGHDYARSRVRGQADLTTLAKVNALRLYLNASLIPSKRSNNAWANAGLDVQVSCGSTVLGCNPTGPPNSTFRWTPATGLSCTDCPNPVASPATTTSYYLEVQNGCVARDTEKVEVTAQLTNNIIADTACFGETTHFSVQNTAGFYEWNFGDNTSADNTSTLSNPTHTYTAPGTYQVQLIYGSSAACRDTIVKAIQVRPKPIVTILSDTVCQGSTAILVANGATSYKWSNGSTNDTLRVTPLTSTSYSVIGTNAFKCSAEATGSVTVGGGITTSFTKKDISCFGASDGSIAVSASGGTPPYSYQWNTKPSPNSPSISKLVPGNYQVTILDNGGCKDTLSIAISQPPRLGISINKKDNTCLGKNDASISITTTGGAKPYSYAWKNNSFRDTSTIKNLSKGNYLVSITDKNGCSIDTAVAIIELSSGLEVQAVAVKLACFEKQDGVAKAIVKGNTAPYTFYWNSDPVQLDSVATLKKGSYQVTVKDKLGCAAVAQVTIQELPFSKVDLGNFQRCFEKDPPLVLQAQAKGSYQWHPNGETTPFITVKTGGTYSVTISDPNGCIYNYSSIVKEVCPPRVFISNSFTPNGDGLNDNYTVFGEHFDNFHMFIFNRWGEIIFETRDKNHVWDGNYKGEQMPLGVYPWLITYTGNSKEFYGPYRMKGSVTIIR